MVGHIVSSPGVIVQGIFFQNKNFNLAIWNYTEKDISVAFLVRQKKLR